MLPVTARPNKQRQGLNLYGHLIRLAGNLRRQWVMYGNIPSYIPFQTDLFYKEEKSVGKEFGI